MPVAPRKTDPPLIINPDTVLPGPVALKSFQSIAADGCKIREAHGGVEPTQPLPRLLLDTAKFGAAKPVIQPLGIKSEKRTYLIRSTYYVVRR